MFTTPLFQYKQPHSSQLCKHDYCRHILIAKDYTGDKDDRLTFWIAGAGFHLVRKVMEFFQGKHLVQGYRVKMCHLDRFVHGKLYWYDMVFVDGLNKNFLSEDSFLEMIIHLLQKTSWCKVKRVTIAKLLNS